MGYYRLIALAGYRYLEMVDRDDQLQYCNHCRLAPTQTGVGDTHNVGNLCRQRGGTVVT